MIKNIFFDLDGTINNSGIGIKKAIKYALKNFDIEIESEERWALSANTEICRRWWHFMADIMETNPDESPVSTDLAQMFHLD